MKPINTEESTEKNQVDHRESNSLASSIRIPACPEPATMNPYTDDLSDLQEVPYNVLFVYKNKWKIYINLKGDKVEDMPH